ncbi:MAG: transposase [Candidatus Cloacimonetes bacterium]|nr:transposase [Candidatus Cloacimonadota bacterium]
MKHKNLPKFNMEGSMHFVTTKTFQNQPFFCNEICCRILIEELDFYRDKYNFKIFGFVIMPDHLHLLLWFDIEKYPDMTISKIIQVIKIMTAKRVKRFLFYDRSNSWVDDLTSNHLPRKFIFWQKGFYDFNIFHYKKFIEKLNYIHKNPFKESKIKSPENYFYSSFSFLETGKGVLWVDQPTMQ